MTYELALELGDRDDTRLEAAMQSMWKAAGIEGCFARDEPVPMNLSSLLQFRSLHGSLVLPIGKRLACRVQVVRQGDAESSGEELTSLEAAPSVYAPDWLYLCLPLGDLAKIDSRVGYWPHGFVGEKVNSSEWRRPMDDWLANIGIQIYATARFRLGLVGYDAALEDRSDWLTKGIPRERELGYLWPDAGGVRYYRANDEDWWWRHGPGAQLMKFRSAGARSLWRFRSTVHNHLNQLERRLEDWSSRMRE